MNTRKHDRLLRPLAAAAALLLGAQALADCAPMAPYRATFNMLSGDKRHAVSTTTLSRADALIWRYGTDTDAKSFVAKLAGARAFEESFFMRDGDTLVPQRYSYDRSTRVKTRRDVIEFDWRAGVARNTRDDRRWELDIPDGALDEYLVNLALVRALCDGDETLVFDVVDRKGRMEKQRYARIGEETVTTPFGEFETVKVERVRDTDARQSYTWHAPALDYLPVRIRHVEKGQDFTAVLTDFESSR